MISQWHSAATGGRIEAVCNKQNFIKIKSPFGQKFVLECGRGFRPGRTLCFQGPWLQVTVTAASWGSAPCTRTARPPYRRDGSTMNMVVPDGPSSLPPVMVMLAGGVISRSPSFLMSITWMPSGRPMFSQASWLTSRCALPRQPVDSRGVWLAAAVTSMAAH